MAARPIRTTRSPVGLAALDGTGISTQAGDDAASVGGCCGGREELTAQRTPPVCRLHRVHRLLAAHTPGGMRGELSAKRRRPCSPGSALPETPPGSGCRSRDHLADIHALDGRLKYIAAQIAALVTASGTTLTAWYAIGPVIAGRIRFG